MEKYFLLSTTGDKVAEKMEMVGYTSKKVSEDEAQKLIENAEKDTLIVESGNLFVDVIDRAKQSGNYAHCSEYNGHTFFTNDMFVRYLTEIDFKPNDVQYFDNFPEAKIELANCHMPVVIRPYGENDPEYIFLVRDYGKGQDAIYDCLDKSSHKHVIIESYI